MACEAQFIGRDASECGPYVYPYYLVKQHHRVLVGGKLPRGRDQSVPTDILNTYRIHQLCGSHFVHFQLFAHTPFVYVDLIDKVVER